MYKVKELVKIKNKNAKQKSIIERHPVPIFGSDFRVIIEYKNSKVTELNIINKDIIISLPNKYKNMNDEKILDMTINKLYEKIAINEIENIMEKTRIMLGFAPEEYSLEFTGNILAKCQGLNIVINPKIIAFDRNIIEYIVLHEFCHLKYKTHSKGFYKLISEYMPDYKKFDKIINTLYKY